MHLFINIIRWHQSSVAICAGGPKNLTRPIPHFRHSTCFWRAFYIPSLSHLFPPPSSAINGIWRKFIKQNAFTLLSNRENDKRFCIIRLSNKLISLIPSDRQVSSSSMRSWEINSTKSAVFYINDNSFGCQRFWNCKSSKWKFGHFLRIGFFSGFWGILTGYHWTIGFCEEDSDITEAIWWRRNPRWRNSSFPRLRIYAMSVDRRRRIFLIMWWASSTRSLPWREK